VAVKQRVEEPGETESARSSTPSARRRAAAPMAESPSGRPARRQWGRFAIGLSVALLGGWLFAALYLSAGGRVAVAVVARDVDRFAVIEEGDLATERVAAGERVQTIPGDEVDDLVGRVAATDLSAGTVLSPSHLVEDETELLTEQEALVGTLLPPGAAPPALAGGDQVELVIVGGASDEDPVVDTVPGWVRDVAEPDRRTGDRVIEFVVPRVQADDVTAAAAQDRLAVYAVRGS